MKSRINVLLAERRITKRSVAEKLGLREETIWRWSTDWGVGGMRLASAERLANVLGCKVKDLFVLIGSHLHFAFLT